MSYPIIELMTPLEVQAPITTSTIKVLHVAEEPSQQTVQAFVDFGAGTDWIPVLDPSNYISNWTDANVVSAVKAWAENQFPPAR